MKSYESLKKNDDFRKVYSKGSSKADRFLVMYVLENEKADNRLGISVSRKVGNSVVRHRLTRLVREAYRLNAHKFSTGVDIVIVARKPAKGRGFRDIESSLLHLGKVQKILL